VDNAPRDDETRALVAERFPPVRYVHEPVQGLDFARNRALTSARGDVVAFLDDDAVAAEGWLGALAAVFDADPTVVVCTGRVEALGRATEGERVFEANGGFSRGPDRIRLPADAARPLHGRPAPLIAWAVSVGSGCSYAVRRATALALGGFDEALDLGAALPGGATTICSGGRCRPATPWCTSRRRWLGTSTGPQPTACTPKWWAISARCSHSCINTSCMRTAGPAGRWPAIWPGVW
jgi:glycosyltransferase involved in cell wall biosynthesis